MSSSGMNQPSNGGGSDDPLWSSIAPNWLVENTGTLKSIVTEPVPWLRRNIAGIIAGGLLSFAFNVADLLQRPFELTVDAFEAAGDSVTGTIGLLGGAFDPLLTANADLLMTVATSFGPLSPAVLFALVIVEALLALRLLLAVTAALEEVVGSIPVIGGVVAGVSAGLRRFFGGLPIP